MSMYEVNLASLQELAIRIRRRELSMEEAANHHIIYDTILDTKVQLTKSVSTLKRLFSVSSTKFHARFLQMRHFKPVTLTQQQLQLMDKKSAEDIVTQSSA